MKEAQLLDELAYSLRLSRRKDRMEDIREKFAEYTMSLKAPLWRRILTKIKGGAIWIKPLP